VGVKLQTIADTRRFLASELANIYPAGEAAAVVSHLLESVTGMSHLVQLRNGNRELTPAEKRKISQSLSRLKLHQPVQHITGYGWFLERKFRVSPGVLIPRQETEELVMLAFKKTGSSFNGTIIDFCTGSGCIAVTLACLMPEAKIWATDNSGEALAVAAGNISDYKANVRLLRHNLLEMNFSALPLTDILVSNPPYVRESEKAFMEQRVLLPEPHEALFVPDEDPLIFYRALLEALRQLLKPGGWFFLEINEDLGGELLSLYNQPFLTNTEILNDIHSKNRFICGTRAT
jgi:release factor glutamine methyltransferase